MNELEKPIKPFIDEPSEQDKSFERALGDAALDWWSTPRSAEDVSRELEASKGTDTRAAQARENLRKWAHSVRDSQGNTRVKSFAQILDERYSTLTSDEKELLQQLWKETGLAA